MKKLLTICFVLLAASALGQTIKSLGYNTTNGQIVAATNVVWTNTFSFSTNVAAGVRTNLGLPLAALTNTNSANFRTAIGLGTAATVNADQDLGTGNAVRFGQLYIAPDGYDSGYFSAVDNQDGSYATTWNSADGNTIIYMSADGFVTFFAAPVFDQSAQTRANLGLGWSALTNTTATDFKKDIGLGATNNAMFQSLVLSNGMATNAALKIGTNSGLFYASGPNRLFLSVDGSTSVFVTSNTVSAPSFSGFLSGGVSISAGQSISFGGGGDVATTRTNLGLGWSALTNSNAATSLLGITTNATVIGPTNSHLIFTNNLQIATPANNIIVSALNLSTNGLYNISIGSLQGGEQFVNFTVNNSSIARVRTNQFQLRQPLTFDGASLASETRTNLGLPLAALTNTSNVTMVRALAGSTDTNEPFSGVIQYADHPEGDIFNLTFSNGILLKKEGPL